jgi:ribose 5-phosphate isomerase RpiB
MTKVIKIFLETPFDAGRHERRVKKVMDIEGGKEPGAN